MTTLEERLAEIEAGPDTWTCPKHGTAYGAGTDYAARFDCPACQHELHKATRDFHDLHERHEWWRERSGVPARYRAATPAHIRPLSPSAKTLAAAVGAYTRDLGQRAQAGEGMVLLGPPGLGKTLALSGIINAACALVRGPVYAPWPDVLAELKAGIGGGRSDPRRRAVERLRDCPVLALDELGIKAASDFDHGELFGLIDYRYREGRPTLAAANCTQANFAGLVGERVADRLREQGPMIVLTGDSLRGKGAVDGADAFPEPPQVMSLRVHSLGKWIERKIAAPEPLQW